MSKLLKKSLLAALFALILSGVATNVRAADEKAPATTPAPEKKADGAEKKKKRDTYPFNGKLKSVDKTAMTFTLEGKEKDRVIAVTPNTKFTKDGKPAILDDGKVGEHTTGTVKKTADGKEEAVTVHLNAPEAKAKAKAKPATEAAPAPAPAAAPEKK